MPRREAIRPRLIVVTDAALAPGGALLRRVRAVTDGARPGSVMVQLRDKDRPARERLAMGRDLVAACRDAGQWCVVNDRCDLAALLECDGVHLGEASISPAEARQVLSPDAWVSVATHSPEARAPEGADAVVLAPVVAARKGRAPLGVEGLARARAVLDGVDGPRPALYALGGVDANSAPRCLEAGAEGVAVIGAALDGRDPRPLLDALGICR